MPRSTPRITPVLEARHHPSGLNSFFPDSQSTFSEYIEHTRRMIAQARTETDAAQLQKIIEGNSPFELRPTAGNPVGKNKPFQRGILLTHGLTDSPYFMRHLAAFFQAQGFLVFSVLLPGHGTRPGDLLAVCWQEWAKIVAFGVEQLEKEVDEIYLGGYSAGGTLSVYQSLRDERIRGLFLFAPALQVSPKAAWAKVHKAYSWIIPEAQWLTLNPDTDIYKYESFPKNAAAQMYALTQAVNTRLQHRAVSIPVFTVASQDDVTVNTEATLEFMAQAPNPANKLIYYYSKAERIPGRLAQTRIECVASVFPERKIIGSAHTAIVLPEDDPHYGAAGEYRNGIHYYPREIERYAAITQRAEHDWLGEITADNLKSGIVRRLMYNPNFAHLKVALHQFIECLPTQ